MATWEYEKISSYVRTSPAPGFVPVLRAFDGTDHFYTTDRAAYDGLPASYQREGQQFYLADRARAGHVPLHRLYHPGQVDHVLTANLAERNARVAEGWEDKGILGHVRSAASSNYAPLYQAYNPDLTDHLYTSQAVELAGLGSPVPDSPAIANVQTGFDPTKNGFLFRNAFNLQPELFGLVLGSWNLGFCGGMSLAAVRAFNTGQTLSRRRTIPRQRERLYDELLQGQIETIPGPVISKVHTWQSSQDFNVTGFGHSIGKRTKGEWPRIRAELERGRPVVLVLIRVRGFFGNITLNHQVVAHGYKAYENQQVFAIQIYDPNWPREAGEIVFSTVSSLDRIHAHQRPRRSGQTVRGFFLNHKG